jgi:hypothetical protein
MAGVICSTTSRIFRRMVIVASKMSQPPRMNSQPWQRSGSSVPARTSSITTMTPTQTGDGMSTIDSNMRCWRLLR